MRVKAKMLLKGDRLRDGRTITAVTYDGMVRATLDDGRSLVMPPAYVLHVHRENQERPVDRALSLIEPPN